MLIDAYLRYFLLSGGQDPYPENDFDVKQKKKDRECTIIADNVHKPTGVVLTDEIMSGKSVTTSVKKTTLKEWYSESKALACMVDTDCFAYVDNKLCIYDKKYLERDENGKLFFTKYAKEHEEECVLQFVIDDETGELHYITLPSSMAINKLESLLRSPRCPFVLYVGKKKLVKRKEFEKFISDNVEI